jgi:hypothetical protein
LLKKVKQTKSTEWQTQGSGTSFHKTTVFLHLKNNMRAALSPGEHKAGNGTT